MDRVWLKQYPPGVPTDIDPDEYPSLREMFAEACAAYGNRPAYSNFGAILTYAQLDELSRIAIPTTVVASRDEADPGHPLEVGERYARAIPQARLVVIPDCGHLSTLEQPAALTRALAGWLAQ